MYTMFDFLKATKPEYKQVPMDDSNDPKGTLIEQHETFLSYKQRESKLKAAKWYLAAKFLTAFNVLFTAFLIWNMVQLKRNYNCVPGPPPPWCEYIPLH